MRYFLGLNLFVLCLFAQSVDVNAMRSEEKAPIAVSSDELIVVEDESGASDDELRAIAKESDKKDKKKIHIKDVFEATDANGSVNMTKLLSKWEDLSPTPLKHDWVKTKSGEWFKGEVKALYDDNLEFDSDEVGLYTFDFDDIVEIKSYNIISVNIENLASFAGVLRLKNKKLTIIQGDNKYEFEKKDIVSFAPSGELERNLWRGKASVSLDIRSGNINQQDFSATVNLKRRTSSSRLAFDYLGRISSKDGEEISNDHRLNEKYDIYLSRQFFWTPIFSEFYTDRYKNIDRQLTAGIGAGYTFVNTKKIEWSFSGGPAFVNTKYLTVADGREQNVFSPALELSTKYEFEINKITDLTYDYKLTVTDNKSGLYKHHMLLKLENELLDWLDFDVTGIWDYLQKPAQTDTGEIPLQSDFQILIGFGVEF
ncbi:MAG: DUF481 domain-containing protein [Sulfurimonas sp.]